MASSSRRAPAPYAPRHVLALFGPTASGKTAVAEVLRERLGAEVVSADSAALYAGVPVITAAPAYPARLVGVVPLEEDVSVGRYRALAHAALDEATTPLLVGGTGLYFRAALSAFSWGDGVKMYCARSSPWRTATTTRSGLSVASTLSRRLG